MRCKELTETPHPGCSGLAGAAARGSNGTRSACTRMHARDFETAGSNTLFDTSHATMQTVAFTVSAPVAVRATVASKAAPASAARSVSCRAALPKGFAAGLTATATALVSSPAWALVDDRLNGDGAGIPFGVNEPVLGAHLLGVATTIWALYYIAQSTDSKIISGGKTEDDGLSL